MEITELRFGRHRIYLTHVASLVLLLDIGDVQKPCFVLIMFIVRYTNARISRDNMVMHRQYGGLLEVHPGDLKEENRYI